MQITHVYIDQRNRNMELSKKDGTIMELCKEKWYSKIIKARKEMSEQIRGDIMLLLSTLTIIHVYRNPEFVEVFFDTIQDNPHWNAKKAMGSFAHLEILIITLRNHPFKNEYRHIKLYNGPYVINVSTKLKSAEKILALIGYRVSKFDRDLYELHHNFDPEHLEQLATQCNIAAMECVFMQQIYKKVVNKGYDMRDVLNCRKEHSGDADSCGLYIIESYTPRNSDPNLDAKPKPVKNKSVSNDMKMSDSGIQSRFTVKNKETDLGRQTSAVINEEELYGQADEDGPAQIETDSANNDDGIDLDFNPNKYRAIDAMQEADLDDHLHAASMLILTQPVVSPPNSHLHNPASSMPSKSASKGSSHEWDFVKEGLVKRYGKDYYKGERGDVLGIERNELPPPKPCAVQARSPIRMFALPRHVDADCPSSKPSSPTRYYNNTDRINALQIGQDFETDSQPRRYEENADFHRLELVSETWQCPYCTYANASSDIVCATCSKSRYMGAESTPLQSGSRVCKYCTLVNDNSNEFCSACDSPLDKSHTYV